MSTHVRSCFLKAQRSYLIIKLKLDLSLFLGAVGWYVDCDCGISCSYFIILAILLQCLYLSADGKTVTVRKTESVSKTAGVGGMSYGKPAGR